jgi:hypothetical protein
MGSEATRVTRLGGARVHLPDYTRGGKDTRFLSVIPVSHPGFVVQGLGFSVYG